MATSYGATGNGSSDDTTAIQNAINAANANGGGIVLLTPGKFKITGTLDVKSGVELRGPYEMRHGSRGAADGKAKGCVIQPYGGQGGTSGPAAIALEANSGVVGVTISYETQNNSCIQFPPAIQGRGANVYVIGVTVPNPYLYVDLATYTCQNHLVYMADGWSIKTTYNVGKGSSGRFVDCMNNWTYWIDNGDSASTLPPSLQAPVLNFCAHQQTSYVLGNCNETLVKVFNIPGNTFIYCHDEAGIGPTATMLNAYADGMIKGFVFDANASSCNINAVNSTLACFNFNNYSDLATSVYGAQSTANFHGKARFFNTSLFAAPYVDVLMDAGDLGFELLHTHNGSTIGSQVNGGVFHMINLGAHHDGTPPAYNVAFGTGAGISGQTSELIGSYAYNGFGYSNPNGNNAVNIWTDYSLTAYSILNGPVSSAKKLVPGLTVAL